MMTKMIERIQHFFASDFYWLFLFLIAYAAVILGEPAIGLACLATLVMLQFLFCADILPAILPLMLCHALTFLCPDAKWLFWLVIPGVAVLLYRLIRNLRYVQHVYSLPGLLLVALAVSLSGLGTITLTEYMHPDVLACTLGLGVGMVLLYLLLKGGIAAPRSYALAPRVAAGMYLSGIFVAFLILRLFVMDPSLLQTDQNVGIMLSYTAVWRNSAANVAVMSLPFIFYYAVQYHPVHLLSAFAVFFAAVISGSRGALVCGALTVGLCLLYLICMRKTWRRPVFVFLLFGAALLVIFRRTVWDFATTFLRFTFDFDALLQDGRMRLYARAFGDFLANPLFGRGFGYTGNTDICPQTVNFYHSMIPQLFGGLGLLGLLAYAYQFYLRLRLLAAVPRGRFSLAVCISYAGVWIYSQIDPGIFSPYPFAILSTFFFVLIEEVARPKPFLRKLLARIKKKTAAV